MDEADSRSLENGIVVAERFRVIRKLGVGAMGSVYLCDHLFYSGRQVALKVLHPEIVADHASISRFRNEILASLEISHPHVVRAYEYVRDGDATAFSMEFISGGDLVSLVATKKFLPIFDVVRLLIQIASGLQAIHDAGIVHRDLKPENVLLTQQKDVKITDFGTIRRDYWRQITETNGIVGTLDYVSPEYLELGQIDYRSDLYALGVIAYELLTLTSPFADFCKDSVLVRIRERLSKNPVNPIFLRPDSPPALVEIILGLLEKDPAKRLQSAREVLQRLTQILFKGDVLPVGRSDSGGSVLSVVSLGGAVQEHRVGGEL